MLSRLLEMKESFACGKESPINVRTRLYVYGDIKVREWNANICSLNYDTLELVGLRHQVLWRHSGLLKRQLCRKCFSYSWHLGTKADSSIHGKIYPTYAVLSSVLLLRKILLIIYTPENFLQLNQNASSKGNIFAITLYRYSITSSGI
jgi:hypothetical protein